MTHYVILWNWTDQGLKSVKDTAKRSESFKEQIEKAGGKVVGQYNTMGQYDGVAIVEASSDEILSSILLANATKGNFHSVTLRAFTLSEVSKLTEGL
jgi:uncharacterized protein with GYD domain